MHSLLSLCLLLPLGSDAPIVVDAGGTGDHLTIQAAIDAASNGDVLLVLPGLYPQFQLDKRLSIIGVEGGPKPQVDGTATITALGEVTLSNLHIESVRAIGVAGRLTIDRCTVEPVGAFGTYLGALWVEDCDQVEVVDSRLRSVPVTNPTKHGAVLADDSTVWITGCELIGHSWAWGAWPPGTPLPSPCFREYGGNGLWAFRSVVRIQGSTLLGGEGTSTGSECGGGPFGTFVGEGGRGILARRSDVRVRNAADAVHGGQFGPYPGGPFFSPSIEAEADTTAWVSSAMLAGDPPTADATSSLMFIDDQPLLDRVGSGEPGGMYTLRLRAPAGAAGWLAIAGPSTPLALPSFDAPIGIDASLLVLLPFVAQGLGSPVDVPLTVPAAFGPAEAGVLLRAQAVFPGLAAWGDPATWATTDFVSLVVGA